jgi:hypothetical protein
MKKTTYAQQVYEAHIRVFNEARKRTEAEWKQKPFETLHASDNKVHAKICVN